MIAVCKKLFGTLLLLYVFGVSAQTPPDWWEVDDRKMHYPPSLWHTGFVVGEQHAEETLDMAFARLKDEARAEAASSIRMSIEKNMVLSNRSKLIQTTTQFDEQVTEVLESTTHTSVEMEIPGLHIEAWQDPKTKEIGAFAYVSHRELLRKTEKQITITLTRIEMAMDGISQKVEAGQKIKAREMAEQAMGMFPEVEQAQKLLQALDDDEEALALDETRTLQQRLSATIEQLRHATAFYIHCQATIGDNAYALLDKEVRGLLAERGCNFTDDRQSADWIIDIDASVINTTRPQGLACFAYVDGTLTVKNGTTGKVLLDGRLSVLEDGHYDGIKGGDFGEERAARIAYHNAADIIANSILKLVQE